jgi:hypothetical protein
MAWPRDSSDATRIAFASVMTGFSARNRDQVRSRVRQTKMMKIATTTAPASIQYWTSKPKTLNF